MVANNVKKKTYILGICLFTLVFCILASPTFAQTEVKIESLNSSLFPFIYSHVSVKSNGISISDLTKDDFQVFENNNLQTEYFEVTPPEMGGGVRLADIVFLIDVSGSMGPEIADVRNNVNNFANALAASNIDFRLGLVRFGNRSGANPYLFNNGNLTGDVSTFHGFVNTLYASGGYEPGFLAIRQAITGFNFRPGAQKVFLIITDEDSDDRNKQQTIDMLMANSITVHSAVNCNSGYSRSDNCDDTSIRGITSGLLFGVRSSYNAILDTIVETTSSTYVVRYKSSNPNFDGTLRNVEIFGTAYGETDSDTAGYIPGATPEIKLTPDTEAFFSTPPVEGASLTISAVITDDVPPSVTSARLYYKMKNDSSFQSVNMTNCSGDLWEGEIPGTSVQYPGIEFYITATDSQAGSSLPKGDPSLHPFNVAVLPNELPIIAHTPPTTVLSGQPVEIVADISDTTYSLQSVKLFYRKKGEIQYVEIGVSVGLASYEFRESIPSEIVTSDGIEYYIEATDDLGLSSTSGTADVPLLISPLDLFGELFDSGFTFGIDNYFFANDLELKTIGDNIATNEYLLIKDCLKSSNLFEKIGLYELLAIKVTEWIKTGGYCYGMSANSVIYKLHEEVKPINQDTYLYTREQAIKDIYKNQINQSMIYNALCFYWEMRPDFLGTDNQKNDYDFILDEVKAGRPVVINLGKLSVHHAVVGHMVVDSGNKKHVFVYDPNHPDNKMKHITFDVVSDNNYKVEDYCINKIPVNIIRPFSPEVNENVSLLATKEIREKLSGLIPDWTNDLADKARSIFKLACPADALIVDQFGRRIGFFQGEVINEIPTAEIVSAGECEVYDLPANLNYVVEITGTGPGMAEMGVIVPVTNGIRVVNFSDINVTDSTMINFAFTSSIVGDIELDLDGDGLVDSVESPSLDELLVDTSIDTDGDGIIDVVDTCPDVFNPDQLDSDGNGIGDVCENMPPIANAGQDQTVAVSSDCMATVTLDGFSSSNPNGDELTYLWIWDSGSATGVNPTILLPLGTTTITLVVNDGVLDSEPDTVDITVADTTSPAVAINVPNSGDALQDGITLMAEATDACKVDEVYFCIREPGGTNGIPIGYENLAATLNESTGAWECGFDTTQLQDGYYVVIAKAIDTNGNEGWSTSVPVSIRNWAVIELLPNTTDNKAGRTMPVKFALRIAAAVDSEQPFVCNEELEIRIYDKSAPDTILQTSLYGDTSTDYRIDTAGELYITNFKTSKTPAEYVVEIWRMSKNFLVGSFTFETVK